MNGSLDRGILANWVRYMVSNPYYFSCVFRVPFTEANLLEAAIEMFGNSHIEWEPTTKISKYKPKRMPTVAGIKAISEFIGVSIKQTEFLMQHERLPCWEENGKITAYCGYLKRWAQRKKIGRHNGGRRTHIAQDVAAKRKHGEVVTQDGVASVS